MELLNPEISIVIPSYNCSEYLPMLFESITDQTYQDFEVIIVDDGSTDNSRKVLSQYCDQYKIYFFSHEGEQKARQKGFEMSNGKYVIFMDADCILAGNYLEELHNAIITDVKIGFAYCDRVMALIQKDKMVQYVRKASCDFDSVRLRRGNYIPFPTLVRREAVVKFDENIKRLQDWDFFLGVVEKGYTGIRVPKALFFMFIRPEGISGRGSEAWKEAVKYIREKHKITEEKI